MQLTEQQRSLMAYCGILTEVEGAQTSARLVAEDLYPGEEFHVLWKRLSVEERRAVLDESARRSGEGADA